MTVRRFLWWSVLLCVLGVTFLLGTIAYVQSFSAPLPKTFHADCAVVFGAAVYPGGRASPALRERTETAVDLFNTGVVDCLVLSGADSAYSAHEVDVMRDVALARGVPLEHMEFHHEGINTRATIEHLSADRSYALVSNDFHLARINVLAQQAGLEQYVLVPSIYSEGRYTREWLFVFREALALWYYGVFSF